MPDKEDVGVQAEFEAWLSEQLRALKADEEVLLPYIVSILEDEEESDYVEAIDNILSSIADDVFRDKIIDKWKATVVAADTAAKLTSSSGCSSKDTNSVDAALAYRLEGMTTKLPTPVVSLIVLWVCF